MAGDIFINDLAAELSKPQYAELMIEAEPNRSRVLAGLMNARIPVITDSPPQETVTVLPGDVVDLMSHIPGTEKGPLSKTTWRDVAAASYPINEAATDQVNSFLLQARQGVDLYVEQAAQVLLSHGDAALVGALLDALEAGNFISAATKQAILDSFQVPDPAWQPQTWTYPNPSVAETNGWPYVLPANVEAAMALTQ